MGLIALFIIRSNPGSFNIFAVHIRPVTGARSRETDRSD